MGGLSLYMGGLGGVGNSPPSGFPAASVPAAAGASPQGPTTIGQKAFGIVSGGSGGYSAAHVGLLSAGFLSLAGLVFIYWSLPR